MRSYSLYATLFLISLLWTEFLSTALVIRISQTGNDTSSCLESNETMPCKSVRYALGALCNGKNYNETEFVFSIEYQNYSLEERVIINQTSAAKSLYLIGASPHRSRSLLICNHTSAGIEVGTRAKNGTNSYTTRNVFFQNLEFQNCGPAVLIWNSVDVNFTNCVFRHNSQAGINAFDSGVTIENCHFVNNTSNGHNSSEAHSKGITSAGGGAGFIFHDAKNLSLLIRDSTFENNVAVTDESKYYVAPSYKVSQIITGSGGGVLVVFRGNTKHCQVAIENTKFSHNTATVGGGIHLKQSNKASGNKYMVTNSNFTGNFAGQTGGGLTFSQWDNASSFITVFKNCIITENRSKRGAGMNVFFMNFDSKPDDSVIRFDSVIFSNNTGRASTAIRFTTALPYGSPLDVTAEFINCTIEDHDMSNVSHTSPFTSQRVNLNFTGTNVFQRNNGGGAAAFQDCVVYVNGKLTFANNTGSNGGALFIRSSQIKLFPGSELVFLGNKARGVGGAIFVLEHVLDEFIHMYNPDCFLAYHKPHLPPSKWKTNVSFIENSSTVKGGAIYISSLQRCVWNEDPPHHNPQKALRWSSNFVYKNNSLILDERLHAFNNDIATDAKSFRSNVKDNTTVKLMPGEHHPLSLQALDELGQEVITIVLVSEDDQGKSSSQMLLHDVLYVLSPNGTVPLSFSAPSTLYSEIENKEVKRTIQFVDPFSTLINAHRFYLELQPCHPGFTFSKDLRKCVCDKKIDAIQRCNNNGTVYLKEGYWANISEKKTLVTYYCPFKYCKCNGKSGSTGCLFDQENRNDQCSENREGWMCGKCKGNTSVGLRWSECIECDKSGWILGVVIPVVIGLCVLIIWLNPGISSELRGPLFFFQVLQFIFDPTTDVGGPVFQITDIFNFGGPFIYMFNTCIFQKISDLHVFAFGYIIPLLALFVFLLAYLLSVNYCLKFKFRRRSMLQSFWLLLLFVYNYLVKTSCLILFCPNVGGKNIFFYDGTVECFHGNHLPLGIIAIMVLVLLVIPPPILVFLLTKGYWRLGNPQYGNILTNSLRPECRWWWSVDLGRRVLVVATYAFIPDWQIKKVVMIVVCMVILTVHSNCQPYMRSRANWAESLYLLVLCVLAVAQIVPEIVDKHQASVYIPMVLLVIVSIHTIVVFFYKAARFFRGRFSCCACAKDTVVDRRTYEELENTETTQSFDTEIERRRSVLDTIFRTPARQQNNGTGS